MGPVRLTNLLAVLVAATDLVLGDEMPTGEGPVGDAGHGQILGDHHGVQCHQVPEAFGVAEQVKLALVAEHGLGDEGDPLREQGLEALYKTKSTKGVQAEHVPKLRRILSALDVATGPGDVDIPGFRTHRLKGRLSGHWSIWVTGNWRVTFRFVDSDVELVDCLDYR